MKALHPFPAKMAPNIALQVLQEMPSKYRILDPMCGSGTVLAEAAKCGISSVGVDSDPLAVAISTVSATNVNLCKVRKIRKSIEQKIARWRGGEVKLPWMDRDPETLKFVDYWFLEDQIAHLRVVAREIAGLKSRGIGKAEVCFFQVALSRLIVTKTRGASLAWDVSHSRPHKVKSENEFSVFDEFSKSMRFLEERVDASEIKKGARVRLGDARSIHRPRNGREKYDAIITSPPYLNAIDYMRGHKMSLIWLGHTVGKLRGIRSGNVGSEKKPNGRDVIPHSFPLFEDIVGEPKYDNAIARYRQDAWKLLRVFHRVLKKQGSLVMVVGDSRIRGKVVENSTIIKSLANAHGGFTLTSERTRDIPENRRYLPVGKNAGESMNKRMKQEHILEFRKVCGQENCQGFSSAISQVCR